MNAANTLKTTALMKAAFEGHLSIVERLVEAGADFNVKTLVSANLERAGVALVILITVYLIGTAGKHCHGVCSDRRAL